MVGEVFELSRAHEGEVGRVEEDDGPMALQIRIRNLLEGAFVVGLGFERQDFSSKQRHWILLVS